MATPREGGLLRVRVQPRAARSEIVGWRADGTLSVRVSAPPVEGAANAAVGVLLADALGVRPSAVSVVHGECSRDKTVRVTGLTLDEMKRRLLAVRRTCMKTWIIVLCGAAILCASPAMAEHNTGPRTESTLDLDVKLDRDGFRLGGRLLGEHVLGAWLNGRITEDGFNVDGRLQGQERAYNFKLNADVLEALKRAAMRWWLLDL